MPYTVTVTEIDPTQDATLTRYTQTVDTLDLNRLIQAVNTPSPEPPKPKKRRSDAGKPRAQKTTTEGDQP